MAWLIWQICDPCCDFVCRTEHGQERPGSAIWVPTIIRTATNISLDLQIIAVHFGVGFAPSNYEPDLTRISPNVPGSLANDSPIVLLNDRPIEPFSAQLKDILLTVFILTYFGVDDDGNLVFTRPEKAIEDAGDQLEITLIIDKDGFPVTEEGRAAIALTDIVTQRFDCMQNHIPISMKVKDPNAGWPNDELNLEFVLEDFDIEEGAKGYWKADAIPCPGYLAFASLVGPKIFRHDEIPEFNAVIDGVKNVGQLSCEKEVAAVRSALSALNGSKGKVESLPILTDAELSQIPNPLPDSILDPIAEEIEDNVLDLDDKIDDLIDCIVDNIDSDWDNELFDDAGNSLGPCFPDTLFDDVDFFFDGIYILSDPFDTIDSRISAKQEIIDLMNDTIDQTNNCLGKIPGLSSGVDCTVYNGTYPLEIAKVPFRRIGFPNPIISDLVRIPAGPIMDGWVMNSYWQYRDDELSEDIKNIQNQIDEVESRLAAGEIDYESYLDEIGPLEDSLQFAITEFQETDGIGINRITFGINTSLITALIQPNIAQPVGAPKSVIGRGIGSGSVFFRLLQCEPDIMTRVPKTPFLWGAYAYTNGMRCDLYYFLTRGLQAKDTFDDRNWDDLNFEGFDGPPWICPVCTRDLYGCACDYTNAQLRIEES